MHDSASLYSQMLSTIVSELKFDSAAMEPTAFYTGIVLITDTFILGGFTEMSLAVPCLT